MQSKARPFHANKTAHHKVITVSDMAREKQRVCCLNKTTAVHCILLIILCLH